MPPDKKAKAGVIGGYLSPEEQKTYMAEQRCFGCHVKGHRKQDYAKWKERQQASIAVVVASLASKTPVSPSTPSVAHLEPSLRQPQVVLDDKQDGVPTRLGLLRAYGSAKGHSFTILFDTGCEEDIISPQLATKLQCTMQPFGLDVDAFTPGIRTRITQIATKIAKLGVCSNLYCNYLIPRCTLPKLEILSFEVAPVVDLSVVANEQECVVEMLSCKFQGSEVVESQNERFSASMRNQLTWDSKNGRGPLLEVNMELNVSLEVYTLPFTLLPISTVETPGNAILQAMVDRMVPLFLEHLLNDYYRWSQTSDALQTSAEDMLCEKSSS
ncbi:hypothetical protein L7F22_022249 [Adiantum nelumboides]|nr:hypothetical protein [Adiantum nelumboides]